MANRTARMTFQYAAGLFKLNLEDNMDFLEDILEMFIGKRDRNKYNNKYDRDRNHEHDHDQDHDQDRKQMRNPDCDRNYYYENRKYYNGDLGDQDDYISGENKELSDLFCVKCRKLLNRDSKFCPECGTETVNSLPALCKNCRCELQAGTKFCERCGIKI
jgi:RNA polymerase subunit RPABC4/transcription elongation factor Spt4